MTARDLVALFRIAPREPAQTLEDRVSRLERQVRYYEELSDEAHARLCDLEAVSDAQRTAA